MKGRKPVSNQADVEFMAVRNNNVIDDAKFCDIQRFLQKEFQPRSKPHRDVIWHTVRHFHQTVRLILSLNGLFWI